MQVTKLVAALGGIGHARPAPGTWAAALVLPAAWLGPPACLALAALLYLAGLWAVARLARQDDADHDPPWVVIDEGAGQLLALAAIPAGAPWLWVVVAFALFRFFDILKFGPVGWADRRTGAFWVMTDDLLAGALAAAAILALRAMPAAAGL